MRLHRCMAILAVGLMMAGCGAASPGSYTGGDAARNSLPFQAKEEGIADYEVASAASPTAAASLAGGAVPSLAAARNSQPTASRRMVITTGSITVEVASYLDAAAEVSRAAVDLGGFVGSTEANVGEAGRRHGVLVLRIPAPQWTAMLDRVRGLGNVIRESSSGQDVTEEYVDLESRLKAQKRLEEELLSLMESARRGGLRDLLEIEREVARVRGEIESMEGRRRYLADQSALATLSVELREPAALVEVEPGALDPIFEALGEAVTLTARSVGAIIVFVAVLLPWLAAAWLLFVLVRWWWRRRK